MPSRKKRSRRSSKRIQVASKNSQFESREARQLLDAGGFAELLQSSDDGSTMLRFRLLGRRSIHRRSRPLPRN